MAQAAMEDLFRPFAAVAIYRDDIGVFNTSWEEQFVSLTKVLAVLKRHNFTVNPRKCEWEPDRLGYLLTLTGFNTYRLQAMEEDPGDLGPRAPADCHAAAFFHRYSHILS
jgi:hypothetical protein